MCFSVIFGMSAECYGEGNEAREMMSEGARKEKKRVCALCCFLYLANRDHDRLPDRGG